MTNQKKLYKRFGIFGVFIYPLFIASVLILLFCFVYYYQPLGGPSIKTTDLNSTVGWPDYLYFSATTFFSLSYGEYLPLGNYRQIAIIENIFSLFFFVNIVGLIFSDLRDEAKEEIWIPLKDKAYEELKFELDTLKANIDLVLGIVKVSDNNGSYFSKQYENIDSESFSVEEKVAILSGSYGSLFESDSEVFKDIQVKYQEYFEPEITANLIDIQRSLRYVDQDINLEIDRDKKQLLQSEEADFEEILKNLVKTVNYIDSIYNILSKR